MMSNLSLLVIHGHLRCVREKGILLLSNELRSGADVWLWIAMCGFSLWPGLEINSGREG